MSTLNELADEVHGIAKGKGFWPEGRNIGEVIALIHSEASEALEEWRDNRMRYAMQWTSNRSVAGTPDLKIEDGKILFKSVLSDEEGDPHERWYLASEDNLRAWGYEGKPVGFPSELADVIIRTLDLSAHLGIDIDKAVRDKIIYNATRPELHGRQR